MSKIIRANANPSQGPDPGLPLLVPSIGTGIVFLSARRSVLPEGQDTGHLGGRRGAVLSLSNLVSHSLRPLRAIGHAGWRWNSRRKPWSSNT
jgi:hypothetical protein